MLFIIVTIALLVFVQRTSFWKRGGIKQDLINLFNPPPPTPAPEPDPEPETDLDVTTSTDDKIVLLLDKLIREQRITASQLDRIRGHLVFYTLMMILTTIWGFLFGAILLDSTYY